ncbi:MULTISPECIES: hypothetical protein [Methylomonas]|uniref:Uncharacterized protein n=2 Tax=Methylomonas TaxID=416 RepID=A0A126T8K9_9GAMM|nr:MULTISPECIES: hypothetical protein [Methylomonas]AMK78423.1 hypothetical protein JT25_018325 [Methylomonas denitrificans]OAI04127.1 hypothetical protein A1342_06250 [Methylomonas methanica]TCV87546.1 hypothetical protein EDE11_10247 [Methylomonas methanica]
MRKIIIITGVLMLNLLNVNSVNAQPQSFSENVIPAATLPALHTTTSEQFDDLKTELSIYSLIAGIYALYWLKQRV